MVQLVKMRNLILLLNPPYVKNYAGEAGVNRAGEKFCNYG
jgi:hypothetical protein